MVIDDLANRRHECDLLLDQNYLLPGRVSVMLLGSSRIVASCWVRDTHCCAPSTPYRSRLSRAAMGGGTVYRYFGGSDPHNLTVHCARGSVATRNSRIWRSMSSSGSTIRFGQRRESQAAARVRTVSSVATTSGRLDVTRRSRHRRRRRDDVGAHVPGVSVAGHQHCGKPERPAAEALAGLDSFVSGHCAEVGGAAILDAAMKKHSGTPSLG